MVVVVVVVVVIVVVAVKVLVAAMMMNDLFIYDTLALNAYLSIYFFFYTTITCAISIVV